MTVEDIRTLTDARRVIRDMANSLGISAEDLIEGYGNIDERLGDIIKREEDE